MASVILVGVPAGSVAAPTDKDGGLGTVTIAVNGAADSTEGVTAAALPPGACTATINNPHYSSGAGGVIFKTRITCTVNATLELSGTLMEGTQVGPGPVVRSSVETRSQMGGVTTTWYTPLEGRAGAPCHRASYYWGSITLRAYGGTIGATSSPHVKVTCP